MAIDITLLDTRPQKVATGVQGPVMINDQPHGALLLGRSSSGLKGLFILPGLIDSDYKGEIFIIVQTNFPPIYIPKGSRIAQLIPLQQLTHHMSTMFDHDRGTSGLGSTGGLALLTMPMNQWPLAHIILVHGTDKRRMTALLDTGADITIVARAQWPSCWPLQHVPGGVEGVGGMAPVQHSQQRIQVILDGKTALLHVTVMPLPNGVNALIGRDVLNQMGVILTTSSPF